MRVCGIDLSLTSTGVAVVDVGGAAAGVADNTAVHTVTSKGRKDATLDDRHMRLHNLRLDICLLAGGASLVVVEGPSLGQARQCGQHDRAGLWWVVVDWLRQPVDDAGWGTPVVEVPPACLKKYVTGRGNAAKDQVLAAAVRRYPDVDISGNDGADAVGLAAMGARWLGHPVEASLPAVNLTAMGAVRWPEAP